MRAKTEVNDLVGRVQRLITSYKALCSHETLRINSVLGGFQGARRKWAESQRKSADNFNLFEVLEVEGDEVSHSKILAWLLDHRIEHGTHAQGKLGFRLFLEDLATDLRKERDGQVVAYANESNYWVRRELSGDESRVDIEIAARGKFLIHVENKILSAEGEDQTDREWRDLQTRRKELDVPEAACHAIFLTLDGSLAKNQSFHAISWKRIATILTKFADKAEPDEVKLFARHYAKALRNLSAVARDEGEDEDGEV